MADLEQLIDRYVQAAKALRPKGPVWEVKPGSIAERELEIDARFLAEIHLEAEELLSEADLRRVNKLLYEWENVFELSHDGTYEERLAALNAESTTGALSLVLYIELCATLGVKVRIREHAPFAFGLSAFGGPDECGPEEISYCWEIIIEEAINQDAVEKMKAFCNKYKQTHTLLRFIDEREVKK